MTIGKTAYMPTFTTIDKAILREYQKERYYTIFLCLQVEIILKKLLLSPAPPPHPVSSLSNCLHMNLVPVNSLNQHVTKPAGLPCIFTWELTGRKQKLTKGCIFSQGNTIPCQY